MRFHQTQKHGRKPTRRCQPIYHLSGGSQKAGLTAEQGRVEIGNSQILEQRLQQTTGVGMGQENVQFQIAGIQRLDGDQNESMQGLQEESAVILSDASNDGEIDLGEQQTPLLKVEGPESEMEPGQ